MTHQRRPGPVLASLAATGLLLPLVVTAMLFATGCNSRQDAPDQAIRVMTFNIRWASPDDGDNLWERRSDWVSAIIDSSGAHVVGLQEVLRSQLADIMQHQSRYAWVGVGRDDGKDGGEFSPILYDSLRFSLVNWETKWLSDRPDSVGSVGWDAALPRVATLISLEDNISGDTLRFLNTHFDHRGETARLESAKLVASWMDFRVAALGDFNFEPDTEPYNAMTERGLVDAGRMPSDPSAEAGTFRSFDPASESSVRIDYIFHSPDWEAASYRVLDPIRNGAYPSDHLPVVVDLHPVWEDQDV